MIAHLLVSFFLTATPVVPGAAGANPPITHGPMTFIGDRVKLETAGAKGKQAFHCQIDGKARVTFGTDGDVDFTIEADKIEVRSDGEGRPVVRAEGHCRYSDGECHCSAEALQLFGEQEPALALSGVSATGAGVVGEIRGQQKTLLTLTGDVVCRFGEAGKERVVRAASMSCVRGEWMAK